MKHSVLLFTRNIIIKKRMVAINLRLLLKISTEGAVLIDTQQNSHDQSPTNSGRHSDYSVTGW